MRIVLGRVRLAIEGPHLGRGTLADFMTDLGDLPQDTKFTLLVPLHLSWTMDSFKVTLRDYPMPLLDVAEASSAFPVQATSLSRRKSDQTPTSTGSLAASRLPEKVTAPP